MTYSFKNLWSEHIWGLDDEIIEARTAGEFLRHPLLVLRDGCVIWHPELALLILLPEAQHAYTAQAHT